MSAAVALGASWFVVLSVGCLGELDAPRARTAAAPLGARLRGAVCAAVVAAAENGVRPASLELRLPTDDGGAEVSLALDEAQLPQAYQCADLYPLAIGLPPLAAPGAGTAGATSTPGPAGPSSAPGPSTYIPRSPVRPDDPLDTRR